MTRRVGSGARMAVVPFTERLPASARPQAGAVRFTSQHGDVERGTLGALQARAGDLQRVPVPELVDAGHRLGPEERREFRVRSEEHTCELQSRLHLVCRLLLEKKKE